MTVPLIYDLRLDHHRPVTQEDIDELLRVKAAYAVLREGIAVGLYRASEKSRGLSEQSEGTPMAAFMAGEDARHNWAQAKSWACMHDKPTVGQDEANHSTRLDPSSHNN